jgi:hypothetical protein
MQAATAWCPVASFDALADDVLAERLDLEELVAMRPDSQDEPDKRSMR